MSSFQQTAAASERVFELLDEDEDIADRPNARELPPIRGHVQFDKVNFSYEKGNPILKDINFTITPGMSVAIVGPTGAGKTTIINLLSRFYNPDNGKILIDGLDIMDLQIKSIRKQVGVMLQDSFLFSGTIMDNIRYGRLDATDEEVRAAARMVHAEEFILRQDKGYDTEVGEGGVRLSTGEKQLISFARVILADPRIFVLDEATSSIDTETEQLIQDAITTVLDNRTSFIVAHRLSTIRNADRILVIRGGEITEQGTHSELIAKHGYYYDLYTTQFREEASDAILSE